jgi:hypothetical protein
MTASDYIEARDKYLAINSYYESNIDLLDDNPYRDLLLGLFKFCTESIERYSSSFNLKPTYFFYHNSTAPNAFADGRHFSSNVIMINEGLIDNLYRSFNSVNINFSEIDLGKYAYLNSTLKHPLNSLMFEAGMIFIFFHEFAHLIQNQNASTYFIEEVLVSAPYNQYRHIKEYDSDLQGCNFVLNYIQQYCEDNFNIFVNDAERENMFWLGLSSVIITLLLLLNNFEEGEENRDFYLRSRTHPHEAMRVYYILEHYIFVMHSTFKLNVTLSDVNRSLRFCREYFDGTDYFTHYFDLLEQHVEIMDIYSDELFALAEKTPAMSRHHIHKFL